MTETLRVLSLVFLIALGVFVITKAIRATALSAVDPYAPNGWYEVIETSQGAIRFNPRTGRSWVLACPGPPKGCEWDPITVREVE